LLDIFSVNPNKGVEIMMVWEQRLYDMLMGNMPSIRKNLEELVKVEKERIALDQQILEALKAKDKEN
jgi:hypothetical protein